MAARLLNGVKYVCLNHENNFKNKSLDVIIIFILRDICWNKKNINKHWYLYNLCATLEHKHSLKEQDENACDSENMSQVYNYLCELKKDSMFEFNELESYFFMTNFYEYMKFDDWWEQLVNLRTQLKAHLKKHQKLICL
jgi:hypothetical protein